MKKTKKLIKTHSRELKKIRRKTVIEIKSSYSKMIYEIHGKK